MSKPNFFASHLQRAVEQTGGEGQGKQADPLDRFGRAAEVLDRQPTVFSVTHGDDPEADANPKAGAEHSPAISIISSLSTRFGTPAYEEVHLSLVDDNPFNARHIYKAERISELADEIKVSGQMTPGIAMRRGERRLLVAGHYRKKALLAAGIDRIKLMTYEGLTDQDLYELSYQENSSREPQTAYDNGIAWRQLLDQKIYASESALATAIGVSLATVNKTLSGVGVSEGLKEIIEQDPSAFGVSILYDLYLLEKLASPAEAIKMADKVLAGTAGRRELQEAKERATDDSAPRRRNAVSRQYRIPAATGTDFRGAIKEWDSGKVLFEIQCENPEERKRLVEELLAKFGLNQDQEPAQ